MWIPKGIQLARKVVRECQWCRRKNVKMQKQLMAALPEERLTAGKPFQFTTLDFFGPFPIKDLAKGRRTLKCWGVVYTCLASRAMALYACPGYDADSFLATQTKFAAVYGEPEKCYADHGTQILAGAKRLGSTTGTGAKKTQWVFTATGCSWRNGAAEVTIRSARRTLAHVL